MGLEKKQQKRQDEFKANARQRIIKVAITDAIAISKSINRGNKGIER